MERNDVCHDSYCKWKVPVTRLIIHALERHSDKQCRSKAYSACRLALPISLIVSAVFTCSSAEVLGSKVAVPVLYRSVIHYSLSLRQPSCYDI
jgi:hypothetical protein